MSLPGSVVLVAFVSTLAGAQPREAEDRVRKEQRLFLSGADATARESVLRVAPRVVTTVFFDTPIVPESVDRVGLGRLFSRLLVEPTVIVLRPVSDMPRQPPPRLTVRFADEAAPRQVTFLLTTDDKEVDSAVEVLRRSASADELHAQLTELRAHCAVTEAGLGALRRQCALSGLAGAILAGVVGKGGVSAQRLRAWPKEDGLVYRAPSTLFLAEGWVAVTLRVHNPPGAPPWVPGVARLRRRGANGQWVGEALELPVHLGEARLAPGQEGQVVVEWPREAVEQGAADYLLDIKDSTGSRGLRWEHLWL